MRKFSEIETDITNYKNIIKDLEDEKKRSTYNAVFDSETRKSGVWAIITCLPATFFVSLSGDTRKLLICGCALFLLSIISAISFLKKGFTIAESRNFTIVSAVMLLLFGIDAIIASNGKSLITAVLGIKGSRLQIGTIAVSYVQFFKYLRIADLIALIPVTICLIGSVVKLVCEIKKRDFCLNRCAELSEQISRSQKSLETLENEYESTKNQASAVFERERKKDNPDINIIEELSKIGLLKAKEWLSNKKGEEIYNEEIQKPQPDINKIKAAADLGYPEACMYYGKSIIFDGEEHTEAENRKIYNRAKPYFKIAAESKINDGELYYIYSRYCSERFTYDGFNDLLNEARKIKKGGLSEKATDMRESLIRAIVQAIDHFYDNIDVGGSSYNSNWWQPSNTGSSGNISSGVDDYEYYPVVSSGEVDLSGSSPMDWG